MLFCANPTNVFFSKWDALFLLILPMSDHCCGFHLIGPSVRFPFRTLSSEILSHVTAWQKLFVHKPRAEQWPQHRTSLKQRVLCRGTLCLSWEATSASSDVPSRWSMERHAGADCCIYRKDLFLVALSSGIWSLTILLRFKLICTWWSVWGCFPPQWTLIKGL